MEWFHGCLPDPRCWLQYRSNSVVHRQRKDMPFNLRELLYFPTINYIYCTLLLIADREDGKWNLYMNESNVLVSISKLYVSLKLKELYM